MQTPISKDGTAALLGCGVVAGLLFPVVVLVQAFTRPGFDLTRWAPSILSLGDLGRIQVSNFVVTGLLFVASAVGTRRVLHPGRAGTWGPLLIGIFGVGLIGGGGFVADPVNGFPPGASALPTMSWHGLLHLVSFVAGCLTLLASCFVFGRRFAAGGQRAWTAYSATVGVFFAASIALLLVRGLATPLYVAVVLTWTWASAVAARLMTERRGASGSTAGEA